MFHGWYIFGYIAITFYWLLQFLLSLYTSYSCSYIAPTFPVTVSVLLWCKKSCYICLIDVTFAVKLPLHLPSHCRYICRVCVPGWNNSGRGTLRVSHALRPDSHHHRYINTLFTSFVISPLLHTWSPIYHF